MAEDVKIGQSTRARRLPPVLNVLLERGDLPATAAGLDELCDLFPENLYHIDAILYGADGSAPTLSQWPPSYDVALVLAAASSYPELPAQVRPILDLVARWLDGGQVNEEALRDNVYTSAAIEWAALLAEQGVTPQEARPVFTRMLELMPQVKPPETLRAFDEALASPVADLAAARLAHLVAFVAMRAVEGWNIRELRRGMAPRSTVYAADAVRIVALARGDALWEEIIAHAGVLAKTCMVESSPWP
jgi:hypothetical protein